MTIPDGYYWAKLDEHSRWSPVWVTGTHVGIIDHSPDMGIYEQADFFTFGPRIEEPTATVTSDTPRADFIDWKCPSCHAESWKSATCNGPHILFLCECGVTVKVAYPPPVNFDAERKASTDRLEEYAQRIGPLEDLILSSPPLPDR